jgi:AcrR family transcriptional regulator
MGMAPSLARPGTRRPVGRPREFDRGEALSAALDLFLKRGYLSASVSELTQAMGINRPSLYAAFGNKEALFRKALLLHAKRHVHRLRTALAEPTASGVAERLLRSAMTDPTLAGGIGGFLGMLASLPDDVDLAPVRQELMAYQLTVTEALEARFAEAQRDGQIRADTHPAALAFLLEAMSHTISVRARSGVSTTDLERLIRGALGAIGCARLPGLA